MDLLQANPFSQRASEAGWRGLFPGVRAIWTAPLEHEVDAPLHRIIHARLLQLPWPARLHRLGLQPAPGYTKCGSTLQIDWPSDWRVLLWSGECWEVARQERNLLRPRADSVRWFNLENRLASAAILELRRCEIDDWWTSWNLAQRAPVLEGDLASPVLPVRERRLQLLDLDVSSLPSGVTAERKPGELRFRTRFFQVGFWLGRAGFSFLGLDEEGTGRTERNLLRTGPAAFLQGIRLSPVGSLPLAASLLQNDIQGTFLAQRNAVTYRVSLGDIGQDYALEWEVFEDRLSFRITRQGKAALRAWESSAWQIVCDSQVAPTTVLGHRIRQGETGLMTLPVLFHAPGHGTLRLSCRGSDGMCRSDSSRPLTMTSLELKVGEIAQPEGDYLLPAGRYTLEGEFTPYRTSPALKAATPIVVARAVERRALTSMTYRGDTGTLSNNGNSMHAPLCMDNWASLAIRIGELLPGLSAIDLLRHSLERWLQGGPGYASGGMAGSGTVHDAEDEYLMSGSAGLLGLAEYLSHERAAEWFQEFSPLIARKLKRMRDRDVDSDGLIESTLRDGRSGGHQWSTNWYDVISFGWKDAFANAILYRALILLSDALPQLGRHDLAAGLREWARALKESYLKSFLNPQTGWLAGWRSADDALHDYAFLAVNGAAISTGVVEGEEASRIMHRLWDEALRRGLPDPRLGLPGNLWPIAEADMAAPMHGRPMGYYLNGGLTHSQSRWFVGALYRVGMETEADLLLEGLCSSLADGSAFSGCNSGVDWRYWDGAPCGYEGILTDQFGILAVAIDRYGLRKEG
jgi:hypothetical protein